MVVAVESLNKKKPSTFIYVSCDKAMMKVDKAVSTNDTITFLNDKGYKNDDDYNRAVRYETVFSALVENKVLAIKRECEEATKQKLKDDRRKRLTFCRLFGKRIFSKTNDEGGDDDNGDKKKRKQQKSCLTHKQIDLKTFNADKGILSNRSTVSIDATGRDGVGGDFSGSVYHEEQLNGNDSNEVEQFVYHQKELAAVRDSEAVEIIENENIDDGEMIKGVSRTKISRKQKQNVKYIECTSNDDTLSTQNNHQRDEYNIEALRDGYCIQHTNSGKLDSVEALEMKPLVVQFDTDIKISDSPKASRKDESNENIKTIIPEASNIFETEPYKYRLFKPKSISTQSSPLLPRHNPYSNNNKTVGKQVSYMDTTILSQSAPILTKQICSRQTESNDNANSVTFSTVVIDDDYFINSNTTTNINNKKPESRNVVTRRNSMFSSVTNYRQHNKTMFPHSLHHVNHPEQSHNQYPQYKLVGHIGTGTIASGVGGDSSNSRIYKQNHGFINSFNEITSNKLVLPVITTTMSTPISQSKSRYTNTTLSINNINDVPRVNVGDQVATNEPMNDISRNEASNLLLDDWQKLHGIDNRSSVSDDDLKRNKRKHKRGHRCSDPVLIYPESKSLPIQNCVLTMPPNQSIQFCSDEFSYDFSHQRILHKSGNYDITGPEVSHKRKHRSHHHHHCRKKRHKRKILIHDLDDQTVKVIDPDAMPRQARWTIIATACVLLIMCLLLVGFTLRMAPIIDDMGKFA